MCHLLRSLHSEDDGLWPVHDITSGEDTAACGHAEGSLQDLDVAFLVDLNAFRRGHDTVGGS